MACRYFVGCAGWALPKALQSAFPEVGSHLERYAARLSAVEINSSFYRPHQPKTYARWAASVPPGFRFAVKVPKVITHERRLLEVDSLLAGFLAEAGALGERLGCLLVQLPPSLGYHAATAGTFFAALRGRHPAPVVFEPRHASWFAPGVEEALIRYRIGRVAADPPPAPGADAPAGFGEVVYFRLHGAPKIYHSTYEPAFLDALAERLHRAGGNAAQVWCIFDNTALGAATVNALELIGRLA